MISLFRKIRRRLLSTGQMPVDNQQYFRYARYAVGEILLVVIGILIALQVNSWKQVRDNREIERNLLVRIKTDLEKDIKEYANVKAFKSMQNASCLRLLDHFIDPSLPITDTVQFLNDLHLTVYFILPNANMTSFEIATSTGQLTKITSDSLVSDLSAYFSDTQLEQHVTETKRYTNAFVENHLAKKYPLFSKYVKANDGQGNSYTLDRYKSDQRPILPLGELLQDVGLENHLNLLSVRLHIGILGLNKEMSWATRLVEKIDRHLESL